MPRGTAMSASATTVAAGACAVRAVEVGTPVHVFGRTPRTREYFRYGPQPARPFNQRPMQPRFDPRLGPPVFESWDPNPNH